MSQSNRCRRLSVAPLAGVEQRGRGSLGSGNLAVGISDSLPSGSHFIQGSHPFPAYCPDLMRGKVLVGEVQSLLPKGAIELAPLPSPGFYSRLFVVMKASGAWRPVIDLSTMNLRVQQTSFKMETLQSVLLLVRPGGWMVSLDLKDAYLQVPMHPESHKFLRFMVEGKVYQFKALCFGLSTALQAFTRVMAPVSAILHRVGVRLRRYLDRQPASSSLELLGVLASMIELVPGGRLRMRSLQLALRRQWDHVDQSQLVEWSQEIRQDLDWWLDRDRLELGISLEQVSPQLELWSDASDVGWGLTWTKVFLPVFRLQRKSSSQSTSGSSWPSRELFCGLLHILSDPRWRSSPTILQPLPT